MMIKLTFHYYLNSLSRKARKTVGVSPQEHINLSDFGQDLGGVSLEGVKNSFNLDKIGVSNG